MSLGFYSPEHQIKSLLRDEKYEYLMAVKWIHFAKNGKSGGLKDRTTFPSFCTVLLILRF